MFELHARKLQWCINCIWAAFILSIIQYWYYTQLLMSVNLVPAELGWQNCPIGLPISFISFLCILVDQLRTPSDHIFFNNYDYVNIVRPRHSRSVAACSHQTFPWTIGLSLSVRRSVCPVHCGKMANQIRMSFVIIGQVGWVQGWGRYWQSVHGKRYFWEQIWGAPL